jgi:hypothetical protein
MIQQAGQWRQTHNPLRGLTSAVVTSYVEAAERGAQADLQWLIFWIERENAVLLALEERFRAALSELDWDVKIPDHVPEADRVLAERQQQRLTEFYHSLRGLRGSIEETGMARFRGCSFLEKAWVRGRLCLDAVPPVYFVRDGYGPWSYNAQAGSGSTLGVPLELHRWVIREVAAPIGRIAARLHVIRGMCLADWQGYVETFGIPAIFAIMPEGVTPEDQAKFQSIMEQIISDARGALPAGTDIKTVTGNNGAGGSPFAELMDWCDKQLVLAGTGGLLTMLAESGSGTLAGGAHMEAFQLLARREAVMVSECFQDQVDAGLLEGWFPGRPQYAYFELAGAEENDPDKVVEHYVALKGAGMVMRTEQLAEKTGYDFEEGAAPDGQEVDPLAVANALPEGVVLNADPAPAADAVVEDDPAADATLAARRELAAALNDDFEGIRTLLLALAELEPGTPEFVAAAEEAQRAVDQLAGAAPGTLAADKAMESLMAEGLLEGWTMDPET